MTPDSAETVPEDVVLDDDTNTRLPAPWMAKPFSADVTPVVEKPSPLPEPLGPLFYPPTEVRRWLICPVLWDYSKRWESRVAPWTPHRVVGSAIHAGVAGCLSRLRENFTDALNIGTRRACEVLRAQYVQQETWGLAGLEALVTKGTHILLAGIAKDLLPGAQLVGVERVVKKNAPTLEAIPGQDHIVDCVLQRGETLEVWDWKTKLKLDARYLPETQQAVLHDWQLLDYAFWCQQAYRQTVTTIGQGLAILGPKLRVEFIKVGLTPARMAQWYADATRIWQLMQKPGWHNWNACTNRHLHYGAPRCPFFEACHLYGGDERQFSALYQSVGGPVYAVASNTSQDLLR